MFQKVKEEVCNYCATIDTKWNWNLFEQLEMAWHLKSGSTSSEMSNLVKPLGVWDKTHRKKDCTLKSMSGLVSCWRAFTNSWITPPLSSNDFSLEHKKHSFHVLVSGRPKSLHRLYILLNKLPVPLTTRRFLKGVALAADHVRVDEGLWIAFCDLLYNMLNCRRLWFVKQSHHLTDPANQQPARHTNNLKGQKKREKQIAEKLILHEEMMRHCYWNLQLC